MRHIFEFLALITENWNGNIYTNYETFEPTEEFRTTTRKDKSDDASLQPAACDATVYAKNLAYRHSSFESSFTWSTVKKVLAFGQNKS